MSETFEAVRQLLVESLELNRAPEDLQPETLLFGVLPELDSFGVLQVVAAVEQKFDITIDDDEFGPELFESVRTLTEFVDSRLAGK